MSATAQCPICRTRPADPVHAPFCGSRCRDVDMGRWLTGAYRVPTEESAPSESSDQTDQTDRSENGSPAH